MASIKTKHVNVVIMRYAFSKMCRRYPPRYALNPCFWLRDARIAKEACKQGGNIGVVATVNTTLDPMAKPMLR